MQTLETKVNHKHLKCRQSFMKCYMLLQSMRLVMILG
nr:MAG TPA: hypothetical protein [Bacteriophage sp.]